MAEIYQVLEYGPPVGVGQSGARHCTLAGVIKNGSSESEYAVANEYICGRLGVMIGLPLPPGALVKGGSNGEPLGYVAFRFGKIKRGEPERFAPVIPEDVVRSDPVQAAGVVAFDCWIANRDRHDENLAFRRPGRPLIVFDHDRALLGGKRALFRARLAELGASVDDLLKHHCLAPVVSSYEHLAMWCERIRAVPDPIIGSVCHDAMDAGACSADEYETAYRFLIAQKANLLGLLGSAFAHKRLPAVPAWGML